MKRIAIITICGLLIGVQLFGVDLGLNFAFNYNFFSEDDTSRIDFETLSDLALIGLFVEVPLSDTMGLRMEEGVKFSEIPDSESALAYDKNIHWSSTIGPVVHFFGKGLIDPFAGVGAGCSGGVFFDSRAYNWATRVQLSIFFFGEAGVNIVLTDMLLIGASVKGIFYSMNPSPLDTYEQFPVSGCVSVGFRI